MDAYNALALIVMLSALYMLPAIIAYRRMHRNRLAILWLDILTGWVLGIGWLVALIWSLTGNVEPKQPKENYVG